MNTNIYLFYNNKKVVLALFEKFQLFLKFCKQVQVATNHANEKQKIQIGGVLKPFWIDFMISLNS